MQNPIDIKSCIHINKEILKKTIQKDYRKTNKLVMYILSICKYENIQLASRTEI